MTLRRLLASSFTCLLVSVSALTAFGATTKPMNVRVGLPGENIYDLLIQQKMLSTTGRPNIKGIENLLQVSVKYGVVISSIPPLEKWVDLSYLDKAATSLK